jgi:HemY protein
MRIFFSFLVFLGSAWVGVHFQKDPGYILIALNHWTIETTLWIGLLSLFLIFVLLHSILLLLNWFLHIPSSWHHWSTRRKVHKAQSKTRKGLIEFSEGYWNQAKNNLIKALPDTDSPLFNYLTAARAAQEMDDNKLRDHYLRQAQQAMPEAKIAVELTQAQLQLANNQWEQALATLRHLQLLAPRHPYVLKLLVHLYEELKDWRSLLHLIPDLKINKLLPSEEIRRLEKSAYQQAISDYTKPNQDAQLTELVDTLPKYLKYDPDLILIYGEYLIAKNNNEKAEHVLRKTLKRQYDDKIVALYGHLRSDSALQFAESLLKTHPHSATLYLALGRLSASGSLWGKAKDNFEESIRLQESVEAYAELGHLYESLQDQAAACAAYRNGNLLAIKTFSHSAENQKTTINSLVAT